MTVITVPAIYRDGALHPTEKLDLPENTPVEVRVTVERGPHAANTAPLDAQLLLKHAGAFQFDSGEMERLLADILRMREMDLEDRA